MGSFCLGKSVLVAINLLLLLASLTLCVLGILVIADPDLIPDALEKVDVDLEKLSLTTGFDIYHFVKSSGVYLLVIGIVLGFVSLSGCWGACYENKCMLRVYITLMVIIMISEIILIVLVAVYPEKLREKGEEAMLKILKEDFKSDMDFEGLGKIIRSNNPEELAFSTMQIQLECCGAAGYKDFLDMNWAKLYLFDRTFMLATLPASCCKLNTPKRYPTWMANFTDINGCLNATSSGAYHEKGCYDGIKDLVNDYSIIVIDIAAGILGLELVLVLFAFCLYRNVSSSKGDLV